MALAVLSALLLGCSGSSGEGAPDAGDFSDAQSGDPDAGEVTADCSVVPLPTGTLQGRIGTSGATIIQYEIQTQPTIDLIQMEFDHSGNWANGTRSIPEGVVESSASNPVALVLGMNFDESNSSFERMFIGFGTFEVHENLPPVVQGPFNPAEIGFFEASARSVVLREFHYDGGELVLMPGGCEFPVSGLRINTSYF